jgi:hypothetical protein
MYGMRSEPQFPPVSSDGGGALYRVASGEQPGGPPVSSSSLFRLQSDPQSSLGMFRTPSGDASYLSSSYGQQHNLSESPYPQHNTNGLYCMTGEPPLNRQREQYLGQTQRHSIDSAGLRAQQGPAMSPTQLREWLAACASTEAPSPEPQQDRPSSLYQPASDSSLSPSGDIFHYSSENLASFGRSRSFGASYDRHSLDRHADLLNRKAAVPYPGSSGTPPAAPRGNRPAWGHSVSCRNFSSVPSTFGGVPPAGVTDLQYARSLIMSSGSSLDHLAPSPLGVIGRMPSPSGSGSGAAGPSPGTSPPLSYATPSDANSRQASPSIAPSIGSDVERLGSGGVEATPPQLRRYSSERIGAASLEASPQQSHRYSEAFGASLFAYAPPSAVQQHAADVAVSAGEAALSN